MHVLPQDVQASKAALGIIPDARLRVSLVPCVGRGARPAPRTGSTARARMYLFDVKTISAAGPTYDRRFRVASGPVANRPLVTWSGAVAERARMVAGEYETAARRLDLDHHGTVAPAVGPVLSALRAYTPVRGLVFGAYGEASPDVHSLLYAAADQAARTQWARLGARSHAEAHGSFVVSLRRHWGLTSLREYARLRLSRVCYVGSAPSVRSAQLAGPDSARVGHLAAFSAESFRAGVRAH